MAEEVCELGYLSATVGALLDRATSEEMVDYAKKTAVLDPLKKIEIFLFNAYSALCGAVETQIVDPSVRRWLFELTDVLIEVEDIMDDIEYIALQRKVNYESGTKTRKVLNFISKFMKSLSADRFKLRMRSVVDKIENISKQRKEGFSFPKRPVSQRLPSHEAYESESAVYGRDAEKESLIELLLSKDGDANNSLRVIPLVGMGGIGKTTLARAIYNDYELGKHFDVKAWVTVSEEFDLFRLTKTVYEAVSDQVCDSPDLRELQFELRQALKQRKVLLVLDDVWNEDYYLWEAFLRPFASAGAGSAILLTTRSQVAGSVAATSPPVHLCLLSEEDSWKLFARHSLEDSSFDAAPDLQTIGREIVRKCQGLPLALLCLSRILRGHRDPKKWQDVLHSSIWEQPACKTTILPTLCLSYHHLSPHLKQCFLYLALFPKGYKFEQENTILLWMAEGLLRPEQGKRLEDVGEEYLDSLISRSMLQESHSPKFFTMHDLVHDLATFVSRGFSHRSANSLLPHNTENKAPLYTSKNCKKLEALPRLNKLHSFLAGSSLSKEVWNPISVSFRVLTLSHDSVKGLPDSLGGLLHLRYLNLSFTKVKKLPNSICRLYHLQTLLLIECKHLTCLPTNLVRLANLRHLNLKGASLEVMPPRISKLKNLQTLSNFVVGKHSTSRIKELRPLQHLHGNLEISRLENVIDVDDLVKANLKDKKFLSGLGLNWSSCAYDSTKGKEALDVLCPITSIKKLEIKSYSSVTFPKWIGSPLFFKMVKLCLVDCKNCCSLPPLGQLPALKELEINGFDELRTIGVEFYYEGSVSNSARSLMAKPFRSLASLILRNMIEWQQWLFVEINDETGLFPSVKEILLERCPKLNVCLPNNLPSLETLKIYECKQLMPLLPRDKLMDSAFPSLHTVIIFQCSEQETFLEGGLPSSIKALTISSCPKLKAFKDMGFKNLASLEHLSINNCQQLQNLQGDVPPASLLNLNADECALLREQFRGETGLDSSQTASIPFMEIS